ncbi:hypothetical protein [Streptomyces sp. SID10815]|uniref:hypothetical protein n=1 Tax=Streptomyces sp. SID10815 TaxID=2706027 RepID=UPI0013CC27F0|nr:hypothetical protein [Streptomyces sp. SID10815]NEA52435.1 hypothetical protein [Streptomyces sp. SID10815]
MTEFSAPFDSSPAATELQWSRMARHWGLDGVHTTDPNSTTLKVTGAGTSTVTVAPGSAFVNGFYYLSDAAKNLTVPANTGGTARVDLVVLRADQSANKVSAEYKTGGTTAPTLTQDEAGVWEIPLAQCTVAAGTNVVTAANTVDRRYLSSYPPIPSIPGARPPSAKGALLVEGTKLYVGDGADWRWLATAGTEDGTYTPAWTVNNGSSALGWGTGATNIGRYQAIGRRVDLTIQLEPVASPIIALSSPMEVSLPPGLPATTVHRSLFTWKFTSGNGEPSILGVAVIYPSISTARIARLQYPVSDGTSTTSKPGVQDLYAKSPVNIRPGDVLTIDGSYWLA